MRREATRRLWRCLLVAAATLAVRGVPAAEWTAIDFGLGPRVVDQVMADLDGDGREDLLLVRGRRAALYLQEEAGGFDPREPLQRFDFVDRAILWTLADLDGDGRREIVYLTADGIYHYRWRRGRLSFVPHRLHGTRAVLRAASPDEVRYKPFFEDVDGDGRRDLLLPGPGSLLLYRGLEEGGFEPPQVLAIRPDVSVDTGADRPSATMRSHYWYPQPHRGEANGDGRTDLFVYQRRQLAVFIQRAGGRFGPAPDRVLPIRFAGALPKGRFQLDIELPTRIADIDGDGLSDVVATHVGRAVTYVFRGRRERDAFERPDVILRLPGVTFGDFLTDLDGDGLQDLVLARADRPGLWDLIKVFVTREVSVEAFVYYGRKDRLFPPQPDERRRLDVPLLFASGPAGIDIGSAAVISVDGDFDGDGRKDLLLREDARHVAVFRNEGRRFADAPSLRLEVPDMEGYRFVEPLCRDLSGDGRADVLLTYYSWDGDADRVVLLWSGRR